MSQRTTDLLDATEEPPAAPPAARRLRFALPLRRRTDLLAVAVVAGVIALAAQLPVLRNHVFYFWNDSEAIFIPTWRLMGEQLRSGSIPLLDPGVWVGGNWAGEAQFGIWNPMIMANAVLISLIPDMVIAAILVKTEFLIILGTGVYLLAREYGARPAAAVAVAVALPFSGYTLYWDATTWAISLFGFVMLPHLWWTSRRFVRGKLHPAWPLVIGMLTMTAGSPYGALGVVAVFAAVAIERLAQRDVRSVLRLAVIAVSVGLTGAIVFLPLLGIQPVGFRSSGVTNVMGLVPELGQLFNLSLPSYTPQFSGAFTATTPAVYLAWFVVPLLPWLRFSVLRDGARARVGLYAFGLLYLLMTVGPSQLWLFRWPARLIEYVYLPICVLLAVLLSAGLHTDRVRERAAGSLGLIAISAYLAWSADPDVRKPHAVAAVVLTLLFAAFLVAYRYRPRLATPVLVAGTVAVLALQLSWFPTSAALIPWHFPHDVAQLRADYADRAEGNTLTVAAEGIPGDEPWSEYVFANVNRVAGLSSLNAYTGMGFQKFSGELCMTYAGAVCAGAYERIFTVDPDTGVPLADLFNLRSVIVRNGYLPGDKSVDVAPPGWEISKRTAATTTIRRVAPPTYPDGRVSWAQASVRVLADRKTGELGEQIRYTGGGRVIIATLAWPGWQATVDGEPVPVTIGRAGLLELDLPQRGQESVVEVSFTPAGLRSGAVVTVVGLLVGVGCCVLFSRRRRAALGNPAAAS